MGIHPISVDKNIVATLDNFGFNLDYAEKCILANKHNQITATYYLLLNKHLR